MKKINTTNIIENTRRQPFNKASLDHIQAAFQEVIADVMKGLTENAAGVVILHGCVDSDAGATAWNLSAGAALYNGEVYIIDAFVGSHATQVPVLSEEVTYHAGDPVTFSDNNTFSVHEIRKLKWAMAVSGSGIADFSAVKRFKDHIKPNNRSIIYRTSAGVESTKITKLKQVEMGDWDMTASPTKIFPHSISTLAKIVNILAIIQNDAGTVRYLATPDPAFSGSGNNDFGISSFDGTNVGVYRKNSGYFDDANFNATSFNRGWLIIEYEE